MTRAPIVAKKPALYMQIYSTSGKTAQMEYSDLNEQDYSEIRSQSSDQEAFPKLSAQLQTSVNFQMEDQYMASKVTFKFVAFKTCRDEEVLSRVPSRLFFTLKFYTFQESKTEMVLLKLPLHIAQKLGKGPDKENEAQQSLFPSRQYFLMRYHGVKQDPAEQAKLKTPVEEEYAKLAMGTEAVFDFDPTQFINQTSDCRHQHEIFCQFLQERAMTIDIWNGDTLMHYGQCKVPLYLLQRYGQPQQSVAHEFDIIETVNATRLGGLQLILMNEGSVIKANASSKIVDGKLAPPKKVVSSKPVDRRDMQDQLGDLQHKDANAGDIGLTE